MSETKYLWCDTLADAVRATPEIRWADKPIPQYDDLGALLVARRDNARAIILLRRDAMRTEAQTEQAKRRAMATAERRLNEQLGE